MVCLEEIQRLVTKNGVRYLTPSIVDINGVLRGKRLPVDQLDKIIKDGTRMPFSAANVDIWGRDIDGSPLVFESGDEDGKCIWTARKPILMNWSKPHSMLIPMSYFNQDGSPYLGDSRNVLVDIVQKFTAKKLTPVLGDRTRVLHSKS